MQVTLLYGIVLSRAEGGTMEVAGALSMYLDTLKKPQRTFVRVSCQGGHDNSCTEGLR